MDGIHQSDELIPGTVVEIRFLAGGPDNFVPHQYLLYAFEVRLPCSQETFPLSVRIDGLGGPPVLRRFNLRAEDD